MWHSVKSTQVKTTAILQCTPNWICRKPYDDKVISFMRWLIGFIYDTMKHNINYINIYMHIFCTDNMYSSILQIWGNSWNVYKFHRQIRWDWSGWISFQGKSASKDSVCKYGNLFSITLGSNVYYEIITIDKCIFH